ncbi:CBS domain-containing protein [Niallia nealsonii]|uniref:CBS domain-containing protein n=1 Tax=Niallia nealsonii TaxID=115979 RepID=A0A2N0Z090_9BACI|nr:CBS domain-containing protein [Niallia nealsonii]PKG22923.1 CBS domain-containing protein [Niallia nealsonii]
MQAYEMMISEVYKVKEDDTVRTVIEKFIEHQISGLPVVNDKNEIIGFISDGDILRYIGKHEDWIVDSFYYAFSIKGDNEGFEKRQERLLNLNVLAIAQKKVISVSAQEEVENIAALLGKKRIKKLPVEQNGVLVGVISRGDVIRYTFKELL